MGDKHESGHRRAGEVLLSISWNYDRPVKEQRILGRVTTTDLHFKDTRSRKARAIGC